jgi:hypothetical protein
MAITREHAQRVANEIVDMVHSSWPPRNDAAKRQEVTDRLMEFAATTARLNAAKTLRAIPSGKRSDASRANGRKGGRPRKSTPRA